MFLRRRFFTSLISKHNISKFLFCLFLFFNILIAPYFDLKPLFSPTLSYFTELFTCFVVFVVGCCSDFVGLRQMLSLYSPCQLVLHPSNCWIPPNHENNLIFPYYISSLKISFNVFSSCLFTPFSQILSDPHYLPNLLNFVSSKHIHTHTHTHHSSFGHL